MRKSKDELELARRFQADVRALYKKYPALTTPAAQRRLAEYLEAEMEKEHGMPPRGARALGEDRDIVSVRLPRSIIAMVDAHVARMRREHPDLPINRVHALSNLVRCACAAIALEDSLQISEDDQADEVPPETPLEPPMDIDPEETPLTMKPTDVTQESVAPPAPAEPVQTAKTTTRKRTARTTKGRN